jgi:hypothetical protein
LRATLLNPARGHLISVAPINKKGKKKAAPLLERLFLESKILSGLPPTCCSFFEHLPLHGTHKFRWQDPTTKLQFGFCLEQRPRSSQQRADQTNS